MNLAAFWAEAAATCTGTLFCAQCNTARICGTADAAYYLRNGWPTCCGFTMLLVKEGSEIPPPRTPPRSPRRSLGRRARAA